MVWFALAWDPRPSPACFLLLAAQLPCPLPVSLPGPLLSPVDAAQTFGHPQLGLSQVTCSVVLARAPPLSLDVAGSPSFWGRSFSVKGMSPWGPDLASQQGRCHSVETSTIPSWLAASSKSQVDSRTELAFKNRTGLRPQAPARLPAITLSRQFQTHAQPSQVHL